jgi:cytochrome c oxidase subunit 2
MSMLQNTLASPLVEPGLPSALLAQASLWDKLWFRDQVDTGTFAAPTDAVFFFIFWVSLFFFVVLMGLMVLFAVKYRRRPGVAPEISASHNTKLEIFWSVVPTILLAVMFFWGLYEYIPMKIAPADAETVNVTAKQWGWDWVYDNGAGTLQTEIIADAVAPVFALPLNKPVKFVMSSSDVIHSMYFPAFRTKRDIFPNFYTTLWVEPTVATHRYDEAEKKYLPINPDVTRGFYMACTEYCGNQHSQMWARIMVLSDADYARWKDEQSSTDSIPLDLLGATLRGTKGCSSCHTVDGGKGTGPSWKGIWGETHKYKDGGSAVVDENYLRESILEPAKHIVEGYPNQMQSYQGLLTDRELTAIIVYIKSLSAKPEDVQAAQQQSVEEMKAKEEAAAKKQ